MYVLLLVKRVSLPTVVPFFFQANVFSAMYKRNGKFIAKSLFPLATLLETKKKKNPSNKKDETWYFVRCNCSLH